MKKIVVIVATALILHTAAYAVQKKGRTAFSSAKAAKNVQPLPADLKNAYNAFANGIRAGKSKPELKQLGLELERQIHHIIDEKFVSQSTQYNADRKRDQEELNAAEQAWQHALQQAVDAEKSGASVQEVERLQQEADQLLKAYEERKGKHTIHGELVEIIKI